MRGWTFSANSAVKITALGVFDHWNPNGLEGSHQVAIWDSSDAIVASATVPAGTGAEKIGRTRYVGVTPLILPAGETFLIAAQYVGADARQDWFAHAYTLLDFDPAISFIEGRSLNTTEFVQPTGTSTTPMIGPNLLIQPVPSACCSGAAASARAGAPAPAPSRRLCAAHIGPRDRVVQTRVLGDNPTTARHCRVVRIHPWTRPAQSIR